MYIYIYIYACMCVCVEQQGVVAKSSYHCASHYQARRMVAQSVARIREGDVLLRNLLFNQNQDKTIFSIVSTRLGFSIQLKEIFSRTLNTDSLHTYTLQRDRVQTFSSLLTCSMSVDPFLSLHCDLPFIGSREKENSLLVLSLSLSLSLCLFDWHHTSLSIVNG